MAQSYWKHVTSIAGCGGALIASQPNWQELLQTISAEQPRRNVAIIVWQIREALGKEDFDYAREIAQGTPE